MLHCFSNFPAGVVLIHEGDQADFLHVLIDGLAEIYTEQDGGEWGISLVNPVSTFILAAIVSDQPYLNSARTLVESRVLLIPAKRAREIFDQDVAFARMVAKNLRSLTADRSRNSKDTWHGRASNGWPTGYWPRLRRTLIKEMS